MTKQLSIDDECTCGSGNAIKDCCFKEIDTKPKGPKTNYSHPKCYARALCDCSSTISKEHFLSRGVQDLFGEEAKVRAPFLEEEGKILKLSSLSSNVLCERHNNALSPLDSLAKKYFEFALGRTQYEFLIIHGTDLERWLLKLMCGVIASGHGQTPSGTLITGLEPPIEALETLFGTLELPKEWGLVIPTKPIENIPDKIYHAILADEHQARGCVMSFSYVRLMLLLHPVSELEVNAEEIHHRPNSIRYAVDNIFREVHLGWPEGGHVTLSFKSVKNNG